jgi:hypothetical protein
VSVEFCRYSIPDWEVAAIHGDKWQLRFLRGWSTMEYRGAGLRVWLDGGGFGIKLEGTRRCYMAAFERWG